VVPEEGNIMRDVRDNLDLAELQHTRIGFISNARPEGVKLHKAGCEAVGAMVTAAYPKKFFETYAEAARWLDEKHSSRWDPWGD
jgi:hypothetical protein